MYPKSALPRRRNQPKKWTDPIQPLHEQGPKGEAGLGRVEIPGCPHHHPVGRSFLRCGDWLELLPNRGQIGKALGTAGYMGLEFREGHADRLSFEEVRQVLSAGVGRFLLFGLSEEHPEQPGFPETVLAFGARMEMASHDRIPQHAVPELRELFVSEMNIRHCTTLTEKTTAAVRFLHGGLRGVTPPREKIPEVLH